MFNYLSSQAKGKRVDFELIALCLWILLVPVMINTAARPLLPPPLGGRLQLSELAFLLLFLSWLIKFLRKRVNFVFSTAYIPLGVYIFSSFLSLKNSQDPAGGIIELIGIAYLAVSFILLVNILRDKQTFYFAFTAWLWTSILVCALGILGILLAYLFGIKTFLVIEYGGFPYLGHLFRVCSTFLPNAKFLSSYLTIAVPLSCLGIFMPADKKERYLWLACLGLFLITLFFTFSRGWLGLAAAIYLLFLKIDSKNTRFRLFKKILAAFIIIFAVFISLISVWKIEDIKVRQYHDGSVQMIDKSMMTDYKLGLRKVEISFSLPQAHYFTLKKIAWQAFKEHPVLGVGPGGFNRQVTQLKRAGELPREFPDFDPHSTFLGRLAEYGILGLAALLLLWGYMIGLALRMYHFAIEKQAGLISWLLFSIMAGFMVQGIDMDIMNFRFIWFIFASLAALDNLLKRR